MSRTIQLHTGNQSLITLVASASTAITASYALSAPGGGLSGGTSNYIPLWTGTSTISSSNLYQNTSNVGIGTTTPATILDVNGGISIGAGKVISASANYTQLFRRDGNVGIYLGGGDPGNYYDNTSHYFRDASGATTRMIINSAGNVGIGTTSPPSTLTVLGNISSSANIDTRTVSGRALIQNSSGGIISLYSGSTSVGSIWAPAGGGGLYINDTNNYNIRFTAQAAALDTVFISSSGNVGIGTTSPNRKLQIGILTPSLANSDLNAQLVAAGGIIIEGGGWLNLDHSYAVHGRIRFDSAAIAAETALKLDSYYGFDFQTRGAASKMVILGNSGDVGIGTTTPAAKLDVSLGKIRAGTITSTNGSVIIEGAYTNGAITTFGTEYSSGGPVLGYGVTPSTASADSFFSSTGINANRGAYVMAGGEHKWSSATAASIVAIGTVVSLAETMRLTTAGSLGIGTTTPAAKLDVRGSILVGTGSVTNTMGATNYIAISTPTIGQSTGLEFYGAAAPYNPRAWITHTHSVSSQALTFNSTFGSGTGYANFIFSNGSVGIGTTSPTKKLDVIGNVLIGQNSNSSTAATLDITAGGNGFDAVIDFGFYNTFDASIWQIGRKGTTERFFISNFNTGGEVNALSINSSTNNVGIGTTNPAQKLDVDGNIRYTGSIFGNVQSGIFFNGNGSFNSGIYSDATGNALRFNASNAEKMRIASNGNVGIGTDAPQYKLHVSGGLSLFNSSTAGSDGNSGIRIVSPISTTHYNWMVAAQQNVGAAFEITPSTAVGGTTFSSPTAVFTATGRVGIGTTAPMTKLTVNTKVTDDFSYVYDTNAVVATHQTATSTTTLNDPKEILVLARQGTSGQAYGAATSFQLSRYENNSTDSRTRLDLVLAHANYLGGPATVMTMRSDGKVGIGTTSPGSTLHIQGNVSASSYTSSISNGVGYFGTASYAVSASYAPGGSSQISAESDQVILCVQIFS